MNPNRREFVWSSLALPAARALWDPSAWLAPQAAGAAAPVALDSRVLLVIQMTGGNDGLNTVVPLDDDLYHRARPRLRVAKGSAVRLTNGLGLHPAMESLRPMWDRGELAVATNIGYPNHDRSHFRSMEIWHTARVEAGAPPIGWLGRGADALGIRDGAAPVLHVGSTEQPLSLVGERIVCPSMVDAERAALRSHTNKTDQGRLLDELCDAPRGAQAAWIASEAKIAYAFAARLEAAAGNFRPAVTYPNTTFARKLRTVAQLLEAGLPARVYQVEIDGFDTHANQGDAHAALLRELSEALASFHGDLTARGRGGKVVSLAFSEFGRRVRENASGGTDHGAAAPVFLLGSGVKGGIHGAPPALDRLDEGDVPMETDFRRVYAAVLDRWLGVPSEGILGGRFAPIACV
jgi:uncharacterized protein (DUF1501 family)